ncbi:MAG: CAAX prenyl protease-related protein [Planctomycetaceae bacterium]
MGSASTPSEQPQGRGYDGKYFIAPYVAFLLLTYAESLSPLKEYYPSVYALKIVLVAIVCWFCRGAYPSISRTGLGYAILAGVLGFVLWIGLCELNLEGSLNAFLPSGLRPAPRVGFNPWAVMDDPTLRMAFLCIRFFGLVAIVPLIEELFMRGWLWRYLQADDFTKVPWGNPSRASLLGVTLFFAITHPEYIAATVWSLLISGLFIRTRNLWSCITAHALTNLLLGAYIVWTEHWELW